MLNQAYRRCCGIDVHKKSVTVCVLPADGARAGEAKKKVFRTFTRDLIRLRVFLKNCRVTDVAMESTGQYWRPLWNLLEGHFEKLLLLNPQHVKGLTGRKTDTLDAEWLACVTQQGHVRGSFVPPRDIRELRDLTRHRVHLTEEINRVKNRAAQICETVNMKVSSVASDLFGASGRRMLRAVIAGNRDAGWMADYARGALRSKKDELELALEGSFSANQVWLLKHSLDHLERIEAEIIEVEAEIRRRMEPYAAQIQRLRTIPGVEEITAWTILAELGPDMSVFGTARQAASWAGLCPGNNESGGRRMGGRTRKANPYIRRVMCEAAWGATHKKKSYLPAYYRRIRSHAGHKKALIALAHHMLIVAFHILKDGVEYIEKGENYRDEINKPKAVDRLVTRLHRLGFYVTLEPVPADLLLVRSPVRYVAPVSSEPNADIDAASDAVAEVSPSPPKRKPGRPCKCQERGIPCRHSTNPNHDCSGISTRPSL
jgi:transposase